MQCDLILADDTGSSPVPQSSYNLSYRALDIFFGDTVQPTTLPSPPADGLMLIQVTASSAFQRAVYACPGTRTGTQLSFPELGAMMERL